MDFEESVAQVSTDKWKTKVKEAQERIRRGVDMDGRCAEMDRAFNVAHRDKIYVYDEGYYDDPKPKPVKCSYCGRYGERYSKCTECGATLE